MSVRRVSGSIFGRKRPGVAARVLLILTPLLPGLLLGCRASEARRLDPEFEGEEHVASMKFRFQPGVTDPRILQRIEAGDIIAFSEEDDSGGSSTAFGIAAGQVSHVALVFPARNRLLAFSADSDKGVYIDSLPNVVKNRPFYIFAFPPGLLDTTRLKLFAERAVFLGRLDYDWSGIFGMNSGLTPNTQSEVGDEYTCASGVAAALHFAGLSLDRAWWGVVTPGDVIHSVARRNLNGRLREGKGPVEPAAEPKFPFEFWKGGR